MPKVYHFFNRYHLGDNILNLKFFYNISHVLKEHNIHVIYYYDTGYRFNTLTELNCYVNPEVLTLKNIRSLPREATELWQGLIYNKIASDFEQFYRELYHHALKIMNIPSEGINTSLWQDEPYLLDIYDRLDNQYKDIDILVINNIGQSGQYPDNQPINILAEKLSKRFNVLVTTPINNTVKCTKGLTIQQYGAISTHCKYVIAVISGSLTCCYNSIAMKNIKKWFFFAQHDAPPHPSIDYMSIPNNDITPVIDYFESI